MLKFILLLAFLIYFIKGQNVGTNVVEFHPPLVTSVCTAQGQCTSQTQSIVLDANWRWLHTVGGSTNCYTGNTWDQSLCPNGVACAANCALEGVDSSQYLGTYGISTAESQLSLGFVTHGPYSTNIGSRVYLMKDDSNYQVFYLKNKEFTFDVDVSDLPCGLNGALYFSEMSEDGGFAAYQANKAGAKYGTGYCDAQCPHDIKFINGEANCNNWVPSSNDPNSGSGQYGSCCSELDIWEANSISTAFTPHPCNVVGQTRCNGTACGDGSQRYDGVCDKDGCDFNSYRMGDHSFYGPGMTIDTNSVITVVTQFITSDNTDNGDLVAIRRFYKQGSTVIENSDATFSGFPAGSNEITDEFCTTQKTLFNDRDIFTANGGLQAMGESMQRGMVLVMSLWDDHSANCLWLDSTYPTTASPSTPGAARGTCPTNSGVPADVEANYPSSVVKFSNIKTGPIGSTVSGLPNGPTAGPTSAPTNAPTKAPTSAPTNPPTSTPTTHPTSPPTQAPPTSPPTSTPTTVPTNTPTQPPTQSPTGCDASSIVISEQAVSSWGYGDDTITQFSVSISTTCTAHSLVALTLHAANWNSYNFWGFTASGNSVTIASGVTITAASPFSWGGYQNYDGSAGFTVQSYTFV